MGRKASNEHHEFLSGFLLILSMAAERNSEELLTCFLFVVTGCPVTLCRALKKKQKDLDKRGRILLLMPASKYNVAAKIPTASGQSSV